MFRGEKDIYSLWLCRVYDAPAKSCFKINQRNISCKFKSDAPEKPIYYSYVVAKLTWL